MLKLFELKAVRLRSNKISESLIKNLVANGVYVITASSREIMPEMDPPYGHYRYTAMPSLEIVMDPFDPPTFNMQGPIWGTKFANEIKVFHRNANSIRATLTTITPSLISELEKNPKLGMIPSLQPHKCKVWLVNQDVRLMSVEQHLDRMLRAIWARVKFPFTRRPHYTSDQFNGFFIDAVKILKVDRKITDAYSGFFVNKSVQVEEIPMCEDIYDSYKDPKPYVVEARDLARARWDHINQSTDIRDKFEVLRELLKHEDERPHLQYLAINEPDYRELYDKYERYVQDSKLAKNDIEFKPPPELKEEVEEELVEPEGYGKTDVDGMYDFAIKSKVQTFSLGNKDK